MLIKLTDKCTMNCPHCMEDAKGQGDIMTLDTFKQAIKFGLHIGSIVFCLSGGEPTENEHIVEMCEWFDLTFRGSLQKFSIVSNGMWLKDAQKRQRVEWICRLPTFIGMQVYTNKMWYKEYDYVMQHQDEYRQYPNVIVDSESHIFMQDLGRAKTNIEAQREVDNNPHFMSCLNAALTAIQSPTPAGFGVMLTLHRQFCKPQVDCKGFVHMSESRMCPNVGNVCTDDFDDIWNRMRAFRPCGGCKLYHNFMQSQRPDIVKAKHILGLL